MADKQKQLVWDLPTRLFHWLLALSIGAQWFTGEQGNSWLEWHLYIGYFILGLIAFRIIWGFVGTRYARFSDFIVSPRTFVKYLKGELEESTGHPPLGGLMVLFFLVVILAQAVSGLFTTDDIFTDGPFRSLISGEMQELADWAHGNLFLLIQIAAAVHIAAAFYYLLVKKTNLIKPMLDGKKEIEAINSIASSKLLLAAVLIAIVASLIVLALYFAPAPVEDEYW